MRLDRQDIYIRRGSTEVFTVTVVDENGAAVNCTGATLRGQIRENPSSATVLANFACTWTNAAGGIGQAVLDAATSTAIPTLGVVSSDYSRYTYDIEVAFNTGEVERVANGFALISPEVTR